MVFQGVYNKAIFRIEASSERMAKLILYKTYGFACEMTIVSVFKYSAHHLIYAKVHERNMYAT